MILHAVNKDSTMATPLPDDTNDTDSQVSTRKSLTSQQPWQQWIALIPILILALGLRVIFIPEIAFRPDVEHFAKWVSVIEDHGFFHFYDENLRADKYDRVYPPLSTLSFGITAGLYGEIRDTTRVAGDVRFLAIVKSFSILAELVLIAVAYWWLMDRRVLRILIPGLLAIHPGLIATSAWWGQFEAPFVLFMVLSLLALNRNCPIVSWVLFAVAVLCKPTAVVLGVLLFVVTLRRYGLVKLIQAGMIGALVGGAAIVPFTINSGISGALSPYLQAGDTFPFVSNNAYNTWFAWASMNRSVLEFVKDRDPDAVPVLPAVSTTLTRKTVGFGAFALYVLLMMVIMWRQAKESREFIWATALMVGFFMLPTQIHERYLYPAVTLSVFAVTQDRRMWVVALGLAVTYTYNLFGVAIPVLTQDQNMFGIETFALPAALLNVLLWGICIAVILVYSSQSNARVVTDDQ